eukprot:Gregarina_sp_Poly_1__3186@NODE_1904_length_3115_cov_606_284121_g1231_i0_p1_GENE_NODE_1904_length_3115_cov_606_284121_g1231_i0NODE_1904_length_3115_cov_606_284121_g1231_i0_p1_ORF_typecomplete_len597_score75_00_NODE_1904_length_3115_cov_606_284121_g1231_i01511941
MQARYPANVARSNSSGTSSRSSSSSSSSGSSSGSSSSGSSYTSSTSEINQRSQYRIEHAPVQTQTYTYAQPQIMAERQMAGTHTRPAVQHVVPASTTPLRTTVLPPSTHTVQTGTSSPLARDPVHHVRPAISVAQPQTAPPPAPAPMKSNSIPSQTSSTSRLSVHQKSRRHSAQEPFKVEHGGFGHQTISPKQWVTVPVPEVGGGGLHFRPRGFSEDGTLDTSSCSNWDIKNKYLIATRTGPTECPDHILARHKHYPRSKEQFASPYTVFYFDETAPNKILLENDVSDKKKQVSKGTIPPKKRSFSYDSVVNKSTDEHSGTSSSTSSSSSSSSGGKDSYQQTSEVRYDQAEPHDYVRVVSLDKREGGSISSSSSMLEDRFDASNPGVFSQSGMPPVYPPRAASRPASVAVSSVSQYQKRNRACCGGRGRNSHASSAGTDITSSRGYTSNSSKTYTSTSSKTSTTSSSYVRSRSSARRAEPRRLDTVEETTYSTKSREPTNRDTRHSISTSFSSEMEGAPALQPSRKKESKRDFSYNIRKMYFDVEDPRIPEKGTGLKMLPAYSVSYRNFPVICYDVIAPKDYIDFFRVRKTPGMYA